MNWNLSKLEKTIIPVVVAVGSLYLVERGVSTGREGVQIDLTSTYFISGIILLFMLITIQWATHTFEESDSEKLLLAISVTFSLSSIFSSLAILYISYSPILAGILSASIIGFLTSTYYIW